MIRLAYPDLEFREVKDELKKVIDSGWLTKGPKTKEFEDELCRYLNVKYAVAVSSGTAALHLSLLSLGIGPGDEVIVPDFTFPATANAVELCGAKAVLADIELDNFCIDPLDIKRKITSRTRAIIPVHQFGIPAQMDEIIGLARRHDLYVLEDAACALGAKFRGRNCGTMGELGCFSFHPRKIITTGEGGVAITDNSRLAKRLRLLREHGMEQDGAKRSFIILGLNYRISEVNSVLGIAQLIKMSKVIEQRNLLAQEFRQVLSRFETISAIPARVDKANYCVYQAFVVKIKGKVNIFNLISFLKEKSIESTISNTSVHMQPYYAKKYNFRKGEFKKSSLASKSSITLPFHCRMDKKDFCKIADALEEYFAKEKRKSQ